MYHKTVIQKPPLFPNCIAGIIINIEIFVILLYNTGIWIGDGARL